MINRQLEGDRKPLISTFKFWDNLKYRWDSAYQSNLHVIPTSSLAEAAQASMKASNEKNISIVDSIYADISDLSRLNAKWKNRLLGELCCGRGPSSLELQDRYELRQIDRANRYVVEKSYQVDDLKNDDSDLPPIISTQKRKHYTRLPASSLPKVKKTRQRSLDSTYTQNVIAKADKMNQLTNFVQCQRRNSQITFVIQCKGQIFNVQIGTNFLCSCSSSTLANRKTFCHTVWGLHYFFQLRSRIVYWCK